MKLGCILREFPGKSSAGMPTNISGGILAGVHKTVPRKTIEFLEEVPKKFLEEHQQKFPENSKQKIVEE